MILVMTIKIKYVVACVEKSNIIYLYLYYKNINIWILLFENLDVNIKIDIRGFLLLIKANPKAKRKQQSNKANNPKQTTQSKQQSEQSKCQ